MYTKIVITFLIFLTPFTIIEQYKQNKSSQLTIKQLNVIKKNNIHLAEFLYDTNEENVIEIEHYWKERDLAFQKRHCSYDEIFLITFKR